MPHGADPGGVWPTVRAAGCEEERYVRPERTGGQEVARSAPGQCRGPVTVQIGHLDRLLAGHRSTLSVGHERRNNQRSEVGHGGEHDRATGRAAVRDTVGSVTP